MISTSVVPNHLIGGRVLPGPRERTEDAQQSNCCESQHQKTHHSNILVNEILHLTRATLGPQVGHMTRVTLGDVCEATGTGHSRRLETRVPIRTSR